MILAALAAALFVVGAYWSYTSNGLTLLTYTYFGLGLFGIAGLLDSLTQRVELHEKRLVIVRNLFKHEYPRDQFVKVQWAKGVPISLQSVSGVWVHLPGVGSSGQGLVNTLRAWLKQ